MKKNASLYAGQIRTALGERLDLIDKEVISSSVILTTSLCMNMIRKLKR